MGSIAGVFKIACGRIGVTPEQYREHIRDLEKWCYLCKSWKSVDRFGVDKHRGDGLNAKCFDCSRVKNRKKSGRPKGAGRAYEMTPEIRQKMSTSHRGSLNHRWKGGVKRYNADQTKIMARRAVNHAVEAGKLIRPEKLPCFDCGKPAREYHHYRGYEKENWFDVSAVCSTCHHRLDVTGD